MKYILYGCGWFWIGCAVIQCSYVFGWISFGNSQIAIICGFINAAIGLCFMGADAKRRKPDPSEGICRYSNRS